MTRIKTITHCALALFLTASFTIPLADAQPGQGGQGGGRGGPPEEAFEACADKADGDACSFSGRRGDVEGSCVIPRNEEETLVCAPADRGGKAQQDRDSG